MKQVSCLSAAWLVRVGIRVLAGLVLVANLVGCSATSQDGEAAVTEPTPASETVAEVPQSTAPGVTESQILFGQSAAFTGPAEQLGKNMEFGIRAAFHEINLQGGVHGRELVLLSLDDAYEPEAAIANTKKLIEENSVFALIGAVGTPTSRSAVPVAFEAGVPLHCSLYRRRDPAQ